MADEIEDAYAFIIDNCMCSSSQKDFLSNSKFSREDKKFRRRKFLGFRGERSESPELKKVRVLEDEIDASEVVFVGGVEVKAVRPIRCVAVDDCGDGVEEEENRSKNETEFDGGVEETEEVEEVEEHEENVGMKIDENFETEVIDAVDEEDVILLTTAFDGVDEETRTSVNEEMVNVDTEVVDVDEEEEMNVNVDTCVIDVEDEERIDVGAAVDGETSNVVMEEKIAVEGKEENCDEKRTFGVDKGVSREEGGRMGEEVNVDTCVNDVEDEERIDVGAAVDRETSNVVMEEKIVVEEKEENCGEKRTFGVDKGVSREEGGRMDEEGTERKKRKLPRSMLEPWEKWLHTEERCSRDARMNVVDGEMRDVNMEEIGVEEKHENRDEEDGREEEGSRMSEGGVTGRKTEVARSISESFGERVENTDGCIEGGEKEENGVQNDRFEIDKENVVLSEEGSRIIEEERPRKLPRSMFEQCNQGLEMGEGCSKDAKMNEVGVDEKQGDCAGEVEEEMRDVNMEENGVEENRDENKGLCDIDEEDVSKDEGSRMSEERKREPPHPISEQLEERLENVEGCIKKGEKEENRVENGKFEINRYDVPREEGSRMSAKEVQERRRKLLHSLDNEVGCSKVARTENNKVVEKFKYGKTSLPHVCNALDYRVGQKNRERKVDDFLETAKRRGMTFPRPRRLQP